MKTMAVFSFMVLAACDQEPATPVLSETQERGEDHGAESGHRAVAVLDPMGADRARGSVTITQVGDDGPARLVATFTDLPPGTYALRWMEATRCAALVPAPDEAGAGGVGAAPDAAPEPRVASGVKKALGEFTVKADGRAVLEQDVRGLAWRGEETWMGHVIALVPVAPEGAAPVVCGVARTRGGRGEPRG